MASSASLDVGAQLIVEECTNSYSLSHMPDIKVEHQLDSNPEEGPAQGVAMGMKFILPNRFDMNVCSRFVKSLNEEDSKNIQDQVNSDLEVASVLFKGWMKFMVQVAVLGQQMLPLSDLFFSVFSSLIPKTVDHVIFVSCDSSCFKI